MSDKPQLKMIYFDMKGRAEPTRLALAIGGIDFEDERISREAFMAAKTNGEYPFGQLPVLVVNGRMVAQSQVRACVRACVGACVESESGC